jgi:hypothetical protein
VTGRVVPEVVMSAADYQTVVLDPIRRDVAPHDVEGILDAEWVNARGAIVRFVRDSIEIRVLDIQETPAADLAIAAIAVEAVRLLTDEAFGTLPEQEALQMDDLESVLNFAIDDGDGPVTGALAKCFGAHRAETVMDVWRHIADVVDVDEHARPLEHIFRHGCLANRILAAVETRPLEAVYRDLCDALVSGRMFGHAG